MCPIQYVVSGTNLIKPTPPPTFASSSQPLWLRRVPCHLAFICRNKPPVQWERNGLFSRAVTRSGATTGGPPRPPH